MKQKHRGSIRPEIHQLRCKLGTSAHMESKYQILKEILKTKTLLIELWKKLDHSVTRPYDYVWLVDEDMDISLFSWDLARLILESLDPMVAAPGVVPVSKFGRRSIWEVTHMQASYLEDTNDIVLARNAWFAEAMVPFISTKFWPLIYRRLEGWDASGLYCIDCFWSHAANR